MVLGIITLTPATIASLEPGVTREINVGITPPTDTEADDYTLALKASGDQADTEREYRIRVVTSTAMGEAGIGIAVGIIVGAVTWFRRAGTRREGETAGSGY